MNKPIQPNSFPVSLRARKVVDNLVRSWITEKTENALFDMGSMIRQLTRKPREMLPALVERLHDRNERTRVYAANWVLRAAVEMPTLLADKSWAVEAETVFVRALLHGAEETKVLACMMLIGRALPACTKEPLMNIVHRSASPLSIFAAAALSGQDEMAAETTSILRHGLSDDNPIVAAAAGIALMRTGILREDAMDTVISALQVCDGNGKYSILTQVTELEMRLPELTPTLVSILQNKELPPYLRGYAARTLAAFTDDPGTTQVMLEEEFEESDNPELMFGLLSATILLGNVPLDAVDRFSALMTSEDAEIRMLAADALGALGTRSIDAVPLLIDRLGYESNAEVADAIRTALSDIGPEAIPHLLSVIRAQDTIRTTGVALALFAMGPDAVPALADAFRTEPDLFTQMALLEFLQYIGPEAAPAVPAIVNVLSTAMNDELKRRLIITLQRIGREAAMAGPALTRCLLEENEEIFTCAQEALWAIGPSILPALDAAIAIAEGQQRERLLRTIAWLRSEDEDFPVDIKEVGEQTMKAFVFFMDYVDKHGPASFQEIARSGKSEGKTYSASGIRLALKKIEEALGFKLTDRIPGRKGAPNAQARFILGKIKNALSSD